MARKRKSRRMLAITKKSAASLFRFRLRPDAKAIRTNKKSLLRRPKLTCRSTTLSFIFQQPSNSFYAHFLPNCCQFSRCQSDARAGAAHLQFRHNFRIGGAQHWFGRDERSYLGD